MPPNARVGVDPSLATAAEAFQLSMHLQSAGHALVPVADNLVDAVWASERPSRPANPICVLPTSYAGHSHRDKIAGVRKFLASYKSPSQPLPTNPTPCSTLPSMEKPVKTQPLGLIVTALDEVAWLLNLRYVLIA